MILSPLLPLAVVLFSAIPSLNLLLQYAPIGSPLLSQQIGPKQSFEGRIRPFNQNPLSQEPDSNPELAKVLNRLKQFDIEEQNAMLQSALETMLAQSFPLFESLANAREILQKKPAKILTEFAPKHFNPAEFAPALKLHSRVYKPNSSRWKSLAKKYSNPLCPPIDVKKWHWSFGEQALIAPKPAMIAENMVKQMWLGTWPEYDLLAAQLTAYFDHDDGQHAIANYFEHSYRDRDGRIYDGLTLEQMWSSGITFGISDVETVAYLRLILDDQKVQSPINKSMHNGLYALIKDGFTEFREYKQLRLAISARFLNPNGKVPLILEGANQRFDLAWVLCDYQLPAMRDLLIRNPTRKKFFAAVAKLEESKKADAELIRQRLEQFHAFPQAIASAAQLGLKREGLLGLRGR